MANGQAQSPLSPLSELDTRDVAMVRLIVSAATMMVLFAKGYSVDGAVQLAVEATDKLLTKLDTEG